MEHLLSNVNDYPEIDWDAQEKKLRMMKHNREQEMRENTQRCARLIEQFLPFLEGPRKDLNKGILHFEEIYTEFSDKDVFVPLIKALKERKAVGDRERAKEIEEDHGVFVDGNHVWSVGLF
jgi:hypothetical protein